MSSPNRGGEAGFIRYVTAHLRGIALACVVAGGVSLGASLLATRQYTAISTVIIQPPAGMDPRGSMAVSPVYLESLKTFELLANSDSLFTKAMADLGLRSKYAGKPIEGLKKKVLAISRPVNTRVLQISATLPDAREAHALALYLAEHTVVLSKALDEQSAADAARQNQTGFQNTQSRLAAAQRAVTDFNTRFSDMAAATNGAAIADLRSGIEKDLAAAREAAARNGAGAGGEVEREMATARVATLEGQLSGFEGLSGKRGALLDRIRQRREFLESDLRTSWAAFEAAGRRREEWRTLTAQGERLAILDAGIVPERPSSPNTALNVIAAVAVALLGSVLWLGFRFASSERGNG